MSLSFSATTRLGLVLALAETATRRVLRIRFETTSSEASLRRHVSCHIRSSRLDFSLSTGNKVTETPSRDIAPLFTCHTFAHSTPTAVHNITSSHGPMERLAARFTTRAQAPSEFILLKEPIIYSTPNVSLASSLIYFEGAPFAELR